MKFIAAGIVLASLAFCQTDPVIEVKPGPAVIKNKDIWDETGVFHPFKRMPKYILADQKAIWTSPFHTTKSDIKWWAIFGGATVATIAADSWIMQQLPKSSSGVSISTWASRAGAAYTLIPVSAGFYFIGTGTHNQRVRETGLIAFETLIDASIVTGVVKFAANRARPDESDGHGHFNDSPNGRINSSFPSGHAMSTWALASVIAHEYPKPLVYVVAYGLATTVVVARVGARKHFPGDVLAGAGMGWFMGDYLYGRRHNRELDRKPPVVRRVLDHVRIGATIE